MERTAAGGNQRYGVKHWVERSRRVPPAKVEALEVRALLSISASSFLGPVDVPGTQWTYQVTTADGHSGTYVRRVIGPATFNGVSCTEDDQSFTNQSNQTAVEKHFSGFDGAGDWNVYGNSSTNNLGETTTQVYTPPRQTQAEGSAGVIYPQTTTTETTVMDSSGAVTSTSKDTYSTQDMIVSETPSSVTVPLGTYEAIDLHEDSTDTPLNPDGSPGTPTMASGDTYFAQGVGVIKQTSSNGTTYELTAFSSTPDHLKFTQQPPAKTDAGRALSPAITVTALDSMDNPDVNATDSVTLSLNSFLRSGTGTLSGTVTEPFVDGVATFSDLSISADGNYQFTAADTAGDPAATSNKFRVGSTGLDVQLISRAPGGAKGVRPGQIVLYSVLVTPPTPLQDQDLVVTLPTGFVAKGITPVVSSSGNTIEWKVNTRLYHFYVQVPNAATLNGLKTIDVSADDNVTYTDGSTDEGTSANTVKIAVDNGLEFTANPGNIAAGQMLDPTVTVAVKDIYGDVDTTSTDTIRLFVRKGTGPLTGTVTQAAVDGVATFDGLSLERAGDYMLQAIDFTNRIIKPGLSDPFAVVGLRAIEATFGRQRHVSTNDDLTFSNLNTFAMPQSDATLPLISIGISDTSAAVLNGVKWTVVRNTDDVASGPDPVVTPDRSNPLAANVNLNQAQGSFNLICYYDSNANGVYDSGEELRIFHLAEVGVVIQNDLSIIPSNASFTGGAVNRLFTQVVSGNFGGLHWAIQSSTTVQLIGGGGDGMLGVNSIHVGWLQNGVGDSAAVTYSNGNTKVEQLRAGSFPILDASYRIGGYSIFELPPDDQDPVPPAPGPTRDPVVGPDPSGGQDRTVSTADSPLLLFRTRIGGPGSGITAVSTSGSNDFAEYLTAYSDDFDDTYTAYFKVNWSANFNLIKAADGTWQNNGATVSESHSDFGGTGKLLSILDVTTSGPLFNKVAYFP
jgi:hypothetical protein